MLFVANDLKQALQIWVLARASHLGLEDKSSLQPQMVLHEIKTNQLAKVTETQDKRHVEEVKRGQRRESHTSHADCGLRGDLSL